jgi:hypothetical protein
MHQDAAMYISLDRHVTFTLYAIVGHLVLTPLVLQKKKELFFFVTVLLQSQKFTIQPF